MGRITKNPNHVATHEIMQDLGMTRLHFIELFILRGKIPVNYNEPERKRTQPRYWLRDKFCVIDKQPYTYEEWKNNIWKGIK